MTVKMFSLKEESYQPGVYSLYMSYLQLLNILSCFAVVLQEVLGFPMRERFI